MSENNINNDNSYKYTNPDTVKVKRIAKKDKINEFEDGSQEFPKKSLNKKVVWELT